jgi:hypothetical protein
MHTRRFAAFVLGLWIAGTLAMMSVATQNFRGVDRLLESPAKAATASLELLGKEKARALLRHQVSELNRFYFESWEYAQIAIGLLLLVSVVFAFNGDKLTAAVVILMLLIVALQRFLFTPDIVSLGRSIDFLPFGAPSPERQRFWSFHMAYTSVELLKLFFGAVLGFKLLVRRDRRPRLREKLREVEVPER